MKLRCSKERKLLNEQLMLTAEILRDSVQTRNIRQSPEMILKITSLLQSHDITADCVYAYYNSANRLIAEINRSAEPDSSFYEMLLPGYAAYKNPELSDLNFLPENMISATYKGKPVQIKISGIDDEKEVQEINFIDGSHICYVTFLKEGKMNINEEEFDMPTGTVVESKFVNDRMFSQLIQLPNMTRKVVAKPEYLGEKQV
jgi:hypothetical protein